MGGNGYRQEKASLVSGRQNPVCMAGEMRCAVSARLFGRLKGRGGFKAGWQYSMGSVSFLPRLHVGESASSYAGEET